jgi:hypothetical protein
MVSSSTVPSSLHNAVPCRNAARLFFFTASRVVAAIDPRDYVCIYIYIYIPYDTYKHIPGVRGIIRKFMRGILQLLQGVLPSTAFKKGPQAGSSWSTLQYLSATDFQCVSLKLCVTSES